MLSLPAWKSHRQPLITKILSLCSVHVHNLYQMTKKVTTETIFKMVWKPYSINMYGGSGKSGKLLIY